MSETVPGVMRCAKCRFVLHRCVLSARTGAVYVKADNSPERCPNGCGPLWPMTWRQQAEDYETRLVAMHDELQSLYRERGAVPIRDRPVCTCSPHPHLQREEHCDGFRAGCHDPGLAHFYAKPEKQVFTPEQVQHLHRHQFGPFDPAVINGKIGGGFLRMHPFTCPNRSDGRHFDNGSDLGALIPTVRGWICQSCDYTQDWAHPWMLNGRHNPEANPPPERANQ